MNDNEKRAHDLALLSTKSLFEMQLSDSDKYNVTHENKKDFKFDTFSEYVKAYNAYLDRFSKIGS